MSWNVLEQEHSGRFYNNQEDIGILWKILEHEDVSRLLILTLLLNLETSLYSKPLSKVDELLTRDSLCEYNC